ncbi:MAG: cellulase family glycosylhydrolase [Lachnospiraceae bacterium]|nr:cellulase family glycosylhydrolase [Lachnospiraceae bacterium]
MSRKLVILPVLVLLSTCFLFLSPVKADERAVSARPSVNGALTVKDSELADSNGKRAVLRGVSLHGLTWFPDFVNKNLFKQVSKEWKANLIRLPVYTEEYIRDRKTSLELLHKGVQAAIDADMYVIVDWHVLDEHNPNAHKEEARDFFAGIAAEYAGCPNIIYEICNEPNGETTWMDVSLYAKTIIPVIRALDPDALILVGTPDYSKDLYDAVRNPLDFDNIMYTLHFYSGTHWEDLRMEYLSAKQAGLPVFISECGLSEASGTGDVNYSFASVWFSMLESNKASYAIWSFSNKNESSALFDPDYNPSKPFTEDDLSGTGQWVSRLLKGEDPKNISYPDPKETETGLPHHILKDLAVARAWPYLALFSALFITVCTVVMLVVASGRKKRYHIYDDLYPEKKDVSEKARIHIFLTRLSIIVSVFFSLIYTGWRIVFSVPTGSGILAVSGNIILLIVEIFGLIESVILYMNLIGIKEHKLPGIEDDEYPDVDIFIATYNEPAALLRKTINGCNHLNYPDKSRVHVWLCDDNRRPEIRKLAEDMGIGYFDRPDNKGAKAGNLNHALSLTKAPYIVTFDADMIPRSSFLMNTIPYFVDAAKHSKDLPEDEKIRLGLLQTPQCFYTPDIFQYALYSEKNAPNEQDFFYRTIETAKTSTNSVIYGGSNTVISREALDAIGGFFTGSITEDFATGMLIEAAGFVSLALPEPMASGMTPHTYTEHIKQRERWGRGVISTAKQLRILRRKGLSAAQKISYLSSVVYWFSPVKNLIYLFAPLLFAVFGIPVFKCTFLDLFIFWLPMFAMQDAALRLSSRNSVSLKWSGIYETSVMPRLLLPIIKETFGITVSVFEVTDKSKQAEKRKKDLRLMMPFFILTALCIIGIIRSVYLLVTLKAVGIAVLLFWLVRNTYFLIMSVFLVDGRDGADDEVNVYDAEPVTIRISGEKDLMREGITTYMNIHSMKLFMDEASGFAIGDRAELSFDMNGTVLKLNCIITSLVNSRRGSSCVLGVEIVDDTDFNADYNQMLYDRIPTLPQSLTRDYGIVTHLLKNIAYRIIR